MSEARNVVRFTLRAMINKQRSKVLFAEIDNEFANVLFSFLILPLGNIVQVLDKHYGDKTPHAIGSLSTLYNGLANLHIFDFQTQCTKPSILNPESAYAFPFSNAKFDVSHATNYDLGEAYFVVFRVFTEEKTSFILSDDLHVVPNGKESITLTLKNVGVDMADVDGAEIRNVTFGLNEVMDFLKNLMISSQPLTNIIHCTRRRNSRAVRTESAGISSDHQIEKDATIYDLKVVYEKSTKKLLFAQAEKDFVLFLYSILTFPLGIVGLVSDNTCLDNIYHLYTSLLLLINEKYLNDRDAPYQLMTRRTFYNNSLPEEVVKKRFLDEPERLFMVTKDLTVTPLCVFSALSLLDQMNISSSDVEELDLRIVHEEAFNILPASLASDCALSDALIKPRLKKLHRPKQKN